MIYILADTNFLKITYGKGTDYTNFYMNQQFGKMIKLVGNKNFRDEIIIAMPDIVLKELIQQKKEAYAETCDQIRDLFERIGEYGESEIKLSEDAYKEILDRQAELYLARYPVVRIPVCENECFPSIIERAIEKKAPFEGVEKKSDKGFKDVLIWYSMLEFAQKNSGEYFFITNDNIFQGEHKAELIAEFYKRTGCEIEFCKNVEEILPKLINATSEKTIEFVDINYKTQEVILRHTNNRHMAKLEYVQPVIFATDDILVYINQDIKQIYDDASAYWDGVDLGTLEDEEDVEYAGEMKGTVTYNEKGKLGLVFDGDIYLGGAHGSPSKIGRVYDLNSGKVLSLKELLNKDEATILKMIYSKWEEDKAAKDPDVYWEYFKPDYKSLDEVKFYLSKQGIHIFFDVYEAGCYAEGFIEFILVNENEVVVSKRIKRK